MPLGKCFHQCKSLRKRHCDQRTISPSHCIVLSSKWVMRIKKQSAVSINHKIKVMSAVAKGNLCLGIQSCPPMGREIAVKNINWAEAING